MAEKIPCEKVRKLFQSMPKRGCEETLRLVSEHLSECEECRSFHANLQKMEELLNRRKLRLDELARHSPIGKSRIMAEIARPRMLGVLASWREKKAWRRPLAKAQRRKAWPSSQASLSPITSTYAPLSTKRRWRLRAVWAGAGALLLVILGVAALLLRERGSEPKVVIVHDTPTRPITRAMAYAASSRTLIKLAEVAQRYEAPPPKLLSGPPESPRGPAVPRLLQKCLLESEKTLRAIAQSRTNLTWRNES